MEWEWESTHSDFWTFAKDFENPLALDVRVDPASNRGANVLSIYTGTITLGRLQGLGGTEFEGPSSSAWSRGILRFILPTPGRRWHFIPLGGIPQPQNPKNLGEAPSLLTYFHGGTVLVSLASISNSNVANNAGWAVDGAHVRALGHETEGLQVEAKVAIRDSDGFIHRLSYQVTALGQKPGLSILGSLPT